MPAPISADLRERIVRMYRRGGVTYAQLVDLFDVSRASIGRFLRQKRATGSVEPLPATGGSPPRFDDAARSELVRLVETHPDATIGTITATWNAEHPDTVVSASTIGRELRRSGLTLKKRRSARRSASGRT